MTETEVNELEVDLCDFCYFNSNKFFEIASTSNVNTIFFLKTSPRLPTDFRIHGGSWFSYFPLKILAVVPFVNVSKTRETTACLKNVLVASRHNFGSVKV